MDIKKETPKPGYTTDKPVIKAIKQIKKLVGIQDSCIQLNEAAILLFEEQALQNENPKVFINDICAKFKISRGIDDLDYLKKTNHKSYILQTYNLVEPSFKKLNKQYKYFNDFTDVWKVKDGKKSLDPFSQLVINLPTKSQTLIKEYPEYYLLNYYRLVRNSIVHLQDNNKEHSITKTYFEDFLKDKLDFFKENYELKAPNEPNNISFEDFMLYTRALKYFTNILNNICFPEIKSLVSAAKKDAELQKKLNVCQDIKNKGVLRSRINTLQSYFIGYFGTDSNGLGREFCREYFIDEGTDFTGFLN